MSKTAWEITKWWTGMWVRLASGVVALVAALFLTTEGLLINFNNLVYWVKGVETVEDGIMAFLPICWFAAWIGIETVLVACFLGLAKKLLWR